MRRRLAPLSALAAAVASLPLITATALGAPFPARVDLEDGWAPEGIAAGAGTTAYVGSLSTGGVARLDLRTGAVDSDFITGVAGNDPPALAKFVLPVLVDDISFGGEASFGSTSPYGAGAAPDNVCTNTK